MDILFLYVNKDFVLKAYTLDGTCFVDFSYLGFGRSYPCPDEELAVELAESIAEFHAKDMEMIDKLFKLDEDLNPPIF